MCIPNKALQNKSAQVFVLNQCAELGIHIGAGECKHLACLFRAEVAGIKGDAFKQTLKHRVQALSLIHI